MQRIQNTSARVAILAVTGAALAESPGCSSAGTDTGPIDTIPAFIDQAGRAMCSWEFRCCTSTDRSLLTGAPSPGMTESDCISYSVVRIQETLAAASSALLSGRLEVDPTKAAACVKSLRDGACNPPPTDNFGTTTTPWSMFMACADPLVGTVRPGGQCFLSDECQPGSQCLPPTGPPTDESVTIGQDGRPVAGTLAGISAVVGACHRYQELGQPCSLNSECDPAHNLYCRRTDFHCAHPAGEGEACSAAIPGLPGVGAGVLCDLGAGLVCANGFCRRLSRAGEPCLSPDLAPIPCDPLANPRLVCVGSTFNGNGLCLPLGQVGDVCGGAGLAPCETSLACVSSNPNGNVGACGALPAAGAACGYDQRCAAPAICDAAWNLCLVPGAGSAISVCSSDEDCATLSCFSNPGSAPGQGRCLDVAVATGPLCTGTSTTTFNGGNIRPTRSYDGGVGADGSGVGVEAGIGSVGGGMSFDGGLDRIPALGGP